MRSSGVNRVWEGSDEQNLLGRFARAGVGRRRGGSMRPRDGRPFGIGPATANRWGHWWWETGERTARKLGHPPGSKLDAHVPYLLGLGTT